MIVEVVHDVPDERIRDLIITSVEGGATAYWFEVNKYDYNAADPYSMLSGREVTDDRKGTLGPLMKLDKDAILRGLKLLSEYCPNMWAFFVDEMEDANVGDVFLQYALLGEVKYG